MFCTFTLINCQTQTLTRVHILLSFSNPNPRVVWSLSVDIYRDSDIFVLSLGWSFFALFLRSSPFVLLFIVIFEAPSHRFTWFWFWFDLTLLVRPLSLFDPLRLKCSGLTSFFIVTLESPSQQSTWFVTLRSLHS